MRKRSAKGRCQKNEIENKTSEVGKTTFCLFCLVQQCITIKNVFLKVIYVILGNKEQCMRLVFFVFFFLKKKLIFRHVCSPTARSSFPSLILRVLFFPLVLS